MLSQLQNTFLNSPLDMLDPKYAKQVFQHYAQSQELKDHVLVQLQDDVVELCAGLPLALKLVGAALAGTRDYQKWRVSSLVAFVLFCSPYYISSSDPNHSPSISGTS
jgi:hypothetical protein